MNVKIQAGVPVFERNGKEGMSIDDFKMESHWNLSGMVVVHLGEGNGTITVSADNLIDAIRRCSK